MHHLETASILVSKITHSGIASKIKVIRATTSFLKYHNLF